MRLWILPVGTFSADETVLDPHCEPGNILFIPVYAYLIETPNGLFLFDTGCSNQCRTNPQGLLGQEFSQLLQPRLAPDDYITAQLAKIGFAPSDIDGVINSHLHFDHGGGNSAFSHHKFLIQRSEWAAVDSDPDQYPDSAALDINTGQLHLLDGDYRFDTRLYAVSTPGHTEGHQSLIVELNGGPIVLTGDAVYTQRQFHPDNIGTATNPDQARLSVAHLLHLTETLHARPFFSHDPIQAEKESWRLSPGFYQ